MTRPSRDAAPGATPEAANPDQAQRSRRLDAVLRARLDALEREGLLRTPPEPGDALVLCSNDYLGLSRSPTLARAAARATRKHGTGAGASRLVAGDLAPHRALEDAIATWMRTEAALWFGTGYAANVGLMSCLAQTGDVVFSDALNHASLIDGLRLGRAERVVYPHCDLGQLEGLLTRIPCAGHRFVVTESVFSMDGDVAPLEALVGLCERHDATLVVDEAHAIGVRGPHGRGVVAELGLDARVPVRVGTAGKSMGGYGAFVVGSAALRGWLWNRARSLVFSTGPAPGPVAAAHAAIALLERGALQRRLWRRIDAMRDALAARGRWAGPAHSAIFPLAVGPAPVALEASRRLHARGFFVQAIRPPTVPEGTSRLRVTVSAALPPTAIAPFADAVDDVFAALGLCRLQAPQ